MLLRPRGFGKSLVLSLVQSIAIMNKEIIRKLAIVNSLDNLKKYPVIKIDFSEGRDHINPVSEIIKQTVIEHLTILNYSPYSNNIGLQFKEILKEYCKIGPAPYILIDECDSPIWNHQNNKENLVTLKIFLRNLKAYSKWYRQVIMLGSLSFRKSDMFSGANNFRDLTLNKKYATLFGFTYNELTEYFSEEIAKLGEEASLERDVILNTLKENYNGYKFHEKAEFVYNPMSVIKCFNTKKCEDHWCNTSGENLAKLKSILCTGKEFGISTKDLSITQEHRSPLDIANPVKSTFLWQAGYLTIDSYDYNYNLYTLKIPNEEARNVILALEDEIRNDMLAKFHKETVKIGEDLLGLRIEKFITGLAHILKGLYAYPKKRQQFRIEELLFTLLSIVHFKIDTQVDKSNGIITHSISYEDTLLTIEVRVDETAEAAPKTIRDKTDFMQENNRNKKSVLIWINYSSKSEVNNIDSFEVYKMNFGENDTEEFFDVIFKDDEYRVIVRDKYIN